MTYYVNPCGPISSNKIPSEDCKGSAVCQVNSNNQGSTFGSASDETFIMEGKTIKVGYSNGVSCTSSSEFPLDLLIKRKIETVMQIQILCRSIIFHCKLVHTEYTYLIYYKLVYIDLGSGKTAAYFLFECTEDTADEGPKFFSVRFVCPPVFLILSKIFIRHVM